jgi:hypothetical protein
MALHEQIQGLIEAVGPQVEAVQAVGQMGDTEWAVMFDTDTTVMLDLVTEQQKLVLSIDLGRPAQESRHATYETMLAYNVLWQETGGVTMGLGPAKPALRPTRGRLPALPRQHQAGGPELGNRGARSHAGRGVRGSQFLSKRCCRSLRVAQNRFEYGSARAGLPVRFHVATFNYCRDEASVVPFGQGFQLLLRHHRREVVAAYLKLVQEDDHLLLAHAQEPADLGRDRGGLA